MSLMLHCCADGEAGDAGGYRDSCFFVGCIVDPFYVDPVSLDETTWSFVNASADFSLLSEAGFILCCSWQNPKGQPQEIASKQPSSVAALLQPANSIMQHLHCPLSAWQQANQQKNRALVSIIPAHASAHSKAFKLTTNQWASAQPTNSRKQHRTGRCNTPTAAEDRLQHSNSSGIIIQHRSCILIIQPDPGLSQHPQSAEGTSPSPIPNSNSSTSRLTPYFRKASAAEMQTN
ncbi:hypothetical protein Nepgr_032284 [Nepenthes gracilis]|uniref:Uncharacterized protein n=1 Tax=Nepenthes gracilis TaxID=150966 RepID=A0AAD3TK08_NEPGR|nr:hypothetical protein Nepgr_032284 [Nepenthes gracilis]